MARKERRRRWETSATRLQVSLLGLLLEPALLVLQFSQELLDRPKRHLVRRSGAADVGRHVTQCLQLSGGRRARGRSGRNRVW